MANLEVVEVGLENHGFSFLVVKIIKEQLADKLALASPETGLICRMEYQNFLFSSLVVNLERLFMFIAEASGGDPEDQLRLRGEVEKGIYSVNPLLDPKNVVLTKSGMLKPKGEPAEGVPLDENPDWGRILEDVNPYITIEEIEIMPQVPFFPMMPPPTTTSSEPPFMASFDTQEVVWPRTNLKLNIRKFSTDDLNLIFASEMTFQEEFHYQIHVIQQCIEGADPLFALCDSMGITKEVTIPVLARELYELCVGINPFLRSEEINLDEIRKDNKRNPKRRRLPGSKTAKKGSGKKFSDVTQAELLSLSARMNHKIVGQPEAVEKIVDNIQIASCGLKDPESPIAVYLMCGTTGIGKTLTSKVLAEELCGSRDNMVRIDCSEYTQQHDIQKLIGAPPSYVGYEDGGFLTNAVQSNPFSVVLFDEIEKAHSKLFDLLLQIMDDARLTDGKGNVTDFKNCIILLTSNVGVAESESVKNTMGFGDEGLLTSERQEGALKQALKSKFRPEFLNRIDETLSFRSLTKEDALKVVDLLLEKVKGYLTKKTVTAEFTTNVKNMIFEKGFSKKYGARPLQRTIDKEIVKALAKMLLKDEIKEGSKVRIDYRKDKLVVRDIKPKASRKKTPLIKA